MAVFREVHQDHQRSHLPGRASSPDFQGVTASWTLRLQRCLSLDIQRQARPHMEPRVQWLRHRYWCRREWGSLLRGRATSTRATNCTAWPSSTFSRWRCADSVLTFPALLPDRQSTVGDRYHAHRRPFPRLAALALRIQLDSMTRTRVHQRERRDVHPLRHGRLCLPPFDFVLPGRHHLPTLAPPDACRRNPVGRRMGRATGRQIGWTLYRLGISVTRGFLKWVTTARCGRAADFNSSCHATS